MAPTFRTLSYLGVVVGVLGCAGLLVALGFAKVSDYFRTLIQEGERREAVETRKALIDRTAQCRRQVTEELIDGQHNLAEVALLYRELNKISVPSGFCPLWPGERSEDEWLCHQVKAHALALATNRSPDEAERVARMIEAAMERYRERDGRIDLNREATPLVPNWDTTEE